MFMLNSRNILETLLPVIDIVLYMHNLARKTIISFWELIALYKKIANLHFKLRFIWGTLAIWVTNLVWAVLGKSYNLHTVRAVMSATYQHSPHGIGVVMVCQRFGGTIFPTFIKYKWKCGIIVCSCSETLGNLANLINIKLN